VEGVRGIEDMNHLICSLYELFSFAFTPSSSWNADDRREIETMRRVGDGIEKIAGSYIPKIDRGQNFVV